MIRQWEDLLRRSAEKICWENLLRRSAEKICWEKICWEDLLRRSAEKICWRKSAEKICWEDLLKKSAEKICWENLLRENLLRRSAEKICWEDLLRKSAEKICWEDLLKKSAEKICWEWLWIKTSLKFLTFFTQGGFGRSRRETTLSSLRAHRTSKTEVKCEFWSSPSQPSRRFVLIGRPKLRWNANFEARRRNPLVVSCSSDVQNWGEMRIFFTIAVATLSSFRAHRTSKTEVKCELAWVVGQPYRRFVLIGRPKLWWNANFEARSRNPLVTSCWSDVRNCGKMVIFVCRVLPRASCAWFIHFCVRRCSKTCILKCGMARRCSETHILLLLDEPSRRIRWVDGTKLWRNANFLWKLSEASRETFVLEALF